MGDRANTTLTRIGEPNAPVVSLADMKDHLRVSTSDHDTYIETLTAAAVAMLDGRDGILNRAIRPQTWQISSPVTPYLVGTISPFEDDHISYRQAWRLPLPPTISVDTIAYTDVNDSDQVWSADNYRVIDGGDRGDLIVPNEDADWPDVSDHPQADNIRIIFQAGYVSYESPSSDGVPHPIRAAVMLMVKQWYDCPMSDRDMPGAVPQLLAPYKATWL